MIMLQLNTLNTSHFLYLTFVCPPLDYAAPVSWDHAGTRATVTHLQAYRNLVPGCSWMPETLIKEHSSDPAALLS